MSDLADRNRDAMISATEKFSAQVSELTLKLVAQDAKIATLTLEIAALKKAQIMANVAAQKAATGHGGTS